jgi:hypothetical protein
VVVRSEEPSSGKISLDPPKERLVDYMELQGNLGLTPITAKVPLTDEKADKHSESKVDGGRIDRNVGIQLFRCDRYRTSRRQTQRRIGLVA